MVPSDGYLPTWWAGDSQSGMKMVDLSGTDQWHREFLTAESWILFFSLFSSQTSSTSWCTPPAGYMLTIRRSIITLMHQTWMLTLQGFKWTHKQSRIGLLQNGLELNESKTKIMLMGSVPYVAFIRMNSLPQLVINGTKDVRCHDYPYSELGPSHGKNTIKDLGLS